MNQGELLQIAETASLAAGKVAREQFGKPHTITVKGFRDLVTDTDLKAQETITRIIQEKYPSHGFLTEEEDTSLPQNGPVIWIIDPIDGTTNYSRNIPIFCVSIAAVLNKQPMGQRELLAGVIYDPMRDEIFSADVTGNCHLNGRPIRTSHIDEIEQAQLGYDWDRAEHFRQTTLMYVDQFSREVDTMRSLGSAALSLAWVAAGRLDGYFNFSLRPWDLAAGTLMIHMAGGSMSTASGKTLDFSSSTYMSCLASNGKLQERLSKYFAQ